MEDPFQNQTLQSKSEVKPSFLRSLKLWLSLVGVFVILVIAVTSFLWWRYQTTDHLIKLAPVDSVMYAHARNSIWPWSNYRIGDLPFPEFFAEADKMPGFQRKNTIDSSDISQAAFILVPDQESNELDWVFLFKANKVKEFFTSLCFWCTKVAEDTRPFKIREDVFAFSTNSRAVEKIKEVDQGLVFSLAGQIDSKRKSQDLMNLYLDSGNLKTYLNQRKQLPDKIFAYLIDQDVYLTLDKQKDKWQFKINGNILNHSTVLLLTEYLPNNFQVFISSINLSEVFSFWGQADQSLVDFFKQTESSMKTIYDFDFFNALELLKKPADVIIFDSEVETAFGFDYVLILDQTDDEQISNVNNLKELIKIILAQKLPKEVKRVLPDNSSVIELMAEPDRFQWQREELDGLEINYLKEPALDFEISYLTKDNKLFLSSSIQLLKDFLSNQDIAIASLESRCPGGQAKLIINNNINFNSYLFNSFLPQGLIVVQNTLFGCIIK